MPAGLEEMSCIIQDALDQLCCPRASSDARTKALELLEKRMASSCLLNVKNDDLGESWDDFLALQYTFECNIPSRLISWISYTSTTQLEQIKNKGDPDMEYALVSQLSRALSIIQGIVLSHDSSKVYLGRRYSLEVLLDLLLASRHLTSQTSSNDDERSPSVRSKQSIGLPLTSTILDTLLCILVDSSPALRAFESANGVQAVVKILKRAGTPREVRMKCLEFLYFYLLDETGPPKAVPNQQGTSFPSTPSATSSSTTTPSSQKSNLRLPKLSLNPTPLRPLSRHGSDSSSEASSSSSSSRSTSGSSTHSFTSISSTSSFATAASSIPSSPEKSSRQMPLQLNPKTPYHTPRSALKFPAPQGLPRRNIMMFKKDVDYEPLSPQKPGSSLDAFDKEKVGTPNARTPVRKHGHVNTPSQSYTQSFIVAADESETHNDTRDVEKRKTTEEKKQLLGTMLGNVDALVEGVRKAGIWGLG